MQTLVLKPNENNIKLACELLNNSQVVSLPTETVYGLFANALNHIACEGIFKAKDRPMDNPLIVHISDYDMLDRVAKNISEDAKKLMDAFWPGAITLILEKQDEIPNAVSAGLNTVGVRMPSNPVALEVIKKSNLPLAGPSANRSGRPSPTNSEYVFKDLQGRIPLILDGGDSSIGVESTVISLVDDIIIYRPGFVTKSDIEEVLGKSVKMSDGIYEELSEDKIALSPGLKHKHYAPKAEITIVNASFKDIHELALKEKATILCFDEYLKETEVWAIGYGSEKNSSEQAVKLFTSLRKLDEIGAKKVFAMMPNLDGVGLAVYNRLLRAAAFRVINI